MSDDTTLEEREDTSLLPGTPAERAAEAEHGLAAISSEELPMLPGEVSPHPEPFQYVIIAVVLCVITALEVGMYYLEGDIPDGLIVALLLVMALAKFVIVASWYMHLRTDKPIFKRFFTVGAVGAVLLYLIVLATLGIFA